MTVATSPPLEDQYRSLIEIDDPLARLPFFHSQLSPLIMRLFSLFSKSKCCGYGYIEAPPGVTPARLIGHVRFPSF
jgi:hypothetical protein